MGDKRSEAEILFPDLDVKLPSGSVVRVRELPLGATNALQRTPGFAEFIAAAHAITPPGAVPSEFDLVKLGVDHDAWWLAFMSAATGLGVDEILAMRPMDGTLLALDTARVNIGFFAAAVTMHRPPTTPTTSPSPTPSPSSSDTDTAIPAT